MTSRHGAERHVETKASPPLDHPVRRRIYRHLLVLPGDHLRSVARSLRLRLGTARYHLAYLVRRGLVQRDAVGGRCRFYPVGDGSEDARNRLYRRHWKYREIRRRILLTVSRTRGARASAVARSLRISRQLASYHLARLAEAGLLHREGGLYRSGS